VTYRAAPYAKGDSFEMASQRQSGRKL